MDQPRAVGASVALVDEDLGSVIIDEELGVYDL